MKLFQKLLLAPAALGLMAPVAASAADLASAGMNDYIQQNDLHNFRVWADQNQVTSVGQLSDVKPTDWAYQALSNLVEKYGCVAGYPNGTYKGGQAMTRYEAAALLSACLDRVTEVTDELQRLQKEFADELAVIKGRVGALEKKVGQLEATQFSTTTKLQGDTFWTIGANAFGGQNNNKINGIQTNAANSGGTVFNYDLRLNLNTSFTGKDLLYTRLRSGNYGNSPFNGQPYSLMTLDRAFGGNNGNANGLNNVFQLDRLYYRFPVGKTFTALIGPRGRNTEFLAVSPFYYGDFEGLDYFRLNGAPGAYNKATGGIAGLMWKQNVKKGKPFFAASTSYVAPNADSGNTGTTTTTYGGVFQPNSAGSWLTQLGYQAQQWKATFGWRYGQCGGGKNYTNRRGTEAAVAAETCGANNQWGVSTNTNNNFAVALAWQPKKSGTFIPSISGGWGYSAYSYGNVGAPAVATCNTGKTPAGISNCLQVSNIAATQSWTVGLQWKDAFVKGNSAGMAVGQPSFVTSTRNGGTPFDGNYAWEWWYKFQVSDNISVTPMLFYLSNPSSAGVNNTATTGVGANVFGGLLAGQIKF
jgi:Carbohydrate-selective porin, OprB family/S-layer homology domain